MTEVKETILRVTELVDDNITNRITSAQLCGASGYSFSHLNRLFAGVTGMTIGVYITRRKLQFALNEIAGGGRILDVALKYGFETHAGFTKACRKHFGYPPSVYRIHAVTGRPTMMDMDLVTNLKKGIKRMDHQIVNMSPIIVVGYSSRHRMPDVRYTRDIPLFWEKMSMDTDDPLIRLYETFPGGKHGEYTVCYDIDEAAESFSYLLGIEVGDIESIKRITSDMVRMTIPGGQYARFTTPWAGESEHAQVVRDIWKKIFDDWLPGSDYLFDETRFDFEHYDERDHIYPGKDKVQIDIYIPVRKK